MSTTEIENAQFTKINDEDDDDISPIEQVRMTVSNDDDPTQPVWTFRMWFLGLISVVLLSFLNTFFSYRTEPLTVTMISVQVATLPIGRFMARVLPTRKFRIGNKQFSFNPGPFNMKEHVLISILANCGGNTAYAISIIDIIRAFYDRKISFFASWLLVTTTQVLGYGWAGIMRKLVVEPALMWWPSSVAQVSLFRALHEKDDGHGLSRGKFFLIALICSFTWYLVPGYLFETLTTISWVCWIFPNSVTAHQIGSGSKGLGVGSFALDWNTIVAFLDSPLITPLSATLNILVGYILLIYIVMPTCYWGLNVYNAKNFPIYSSHLFTAQGMEYDVKGIVNKKFELDMEEYQKQGHINLSMFFAVSYGIGFAAIAATLSHVAIFNGREIYQQWSSRSRKEDIHTRLMKNYKDIPNWWFHTMLIISFVLALILVIFMKDEIQLPWWALIFAASFALIFTPFISVIKATTNQSPGLNVISEYLIGLVYPGKPIANVCFKTYGYISMQQAVFFLNDFKLGHYMKIPPRSMFIVQTIGTLIAGTINVCVAWWMLGSIKNICNTDLLPPDSEWTCPGDRVFFDASVIWGLIGPWRIFGPTGNYPQLNLFFIFGLIGPGIIWLLYKAFPNQKWLLSIHLPVLLGATANMPPASTVNFNSWLVVALVFNYFIYKHYRKWWSKYTYVLSGALDAGMAFMLVLLYFTLNMEGKSLDWWGQSEHCALAKCPTAKGISVPGCPVF
ncbi:hypothetical protein TanjilG_12592 [Lupinus angustifolius]|uniref:Oligopeptide transporter n=1 Tax=Lupinus angustifolius TaxID=3871 RepID=A0A4P1QYW9_LUPAN|nr:PREDICTED: oligopeptide transporter 2-like [Lupinus angustifolius]OIV97835.1 hypothetical protein TanjilG_12592 [Lupinus angustifolius]